MASGGDWYGSIRPAGRDPAPVRRTLSLMEEPGPQDKVHMWTELVDKVAGELDTLSGTLSEDLATYNPQINAGQVTIGGNEPMSNSFRPTYNDTARAAREIGGQLPGVYEDVAEAGRASIQMYLSADAAGADGMPR
jgi:hypothetical protein